MSAGKGTGVWGYGRMETWTHSYLPTLPRSLAHTRAAGLAAAVVLVATILRILPWLTNYPLHHDEALYGYWARLIASGQDLLLLTPWVDKPPLTLYLLASSIRAFGVSELALRLPGLIAGLLTVWGVFGLARRAYGMRVAFAAAGLLALSPFAILFGPTAFTDPWLTLWLVLAAWAAFARRPFLAGVMLGLAVASKQQGVLGMPLVFALLAAGNQQTANSKRQRAETLRDLVAAILGFALIFVPITYWDSLRWVNRPSFWDRSVTTYGQLTLAPLAEWTQRAADWVTQIGYLFGLPALSALMLLVAAAVGGRAILLLRETQRNRLRRCVDAILALYIIGYLALHFAVTFQPWDRYLLPILPLVCVLAGRGLVLGWDRLGSWPKLRRSGRVMGLLLLVPALLYAAGLGAGGRLPVGSDHSANAGLDRVVATLRNQPADAVIYHRWLGWHYDFYLFDAPQERRWWGSGWKLADDAASTARTEPGRPQWVVLPGWESTAIEELSLPLASRGLTLVEIERIFRPDGSRAFAMYRIAPLGAEVTR